jgi:hypothetical protein
MLKVTKEEYVIDGHSWGRDINIYRNPTSGEMNDIYKDGDTIKILGYKKDVYVANATYILHAKMAEALNPITGLKLMDYVQLYYDSKGKRLYAGYSYNNEHDSQDYFKRLLKIIPTLLDLGIIYEKTKVNGFGKWTDNEEDYEGFTVREILDKYTRQRVKVSAE